MQFEWDEGKEQRNRLKHHVSFPEARSVFFDENAFEAFDPDHSEEEERFLMLGLSSRMRLLVVSYHYRFSEPLIRIISARKATREERRFYDAGKA